MTMSNGQQEGTGEHRPRRVGMPRDLSRGSTKVRLGDLFWVGGSVLLQSVATTLGKQAGLESVGGGVLVLVLNPWYVGMLVALGLQAVFWFSALRRIELSVAYPFMSLVLPLNLLFAHGVFGEPIAWNHMVGVLIIACGIVVVSR